MSSYTIFDLLLTDLLKKQIDQLYFLYICLFLDFITSVGPKKQTIHLHKLIYWKELAYIIINTKIIFRK